MIIFYFQNFKAKYPGSTDQWSNKQDVFEDDEEDDEEISEKEEEIEFVEPYKTNFGEGVFRRSPRDTTTRGTTTSTTTTTTSSTTTTTLSTTLITWSPAPVEVTSPKSTSLQSLLYGTNRPKDSRPNSIFDVLNVPAGQSAPPVFSISLPPSIVGPSNRPRVKSK